MFTIFVLHFSLEKQLNVNIAVEKFATTQTLHCFNFWWTSVLFVEPLISLFWVSGDLCPGFRSQGGPPHLHASLTVHDGFLRFTSNATPADLLVASVAAKLFSSPYLQTTIGGAQDWDLSNRQMIYNKV